MQLRVRKKAGKEAEDVLDADGSGKSVWGKLWGGKQGAAFTSVLECGQHIRLCKVYVLIPAALTG